MNIRSLIVMVLLCCGTLARSYNVFAHEDVIFAKINKESNLQFTYWNEADSTQTSIAAELVRRLNASLNYKKPIAVEFVEDLAKNVPYQYALSFEKEISFQSRGILLRVFSKNIRPKEILNLVSFAVSNEKYILESQDTLIGRFGSTRYLSIPQKKIDEIVCTPTSTVDSVCKKRVYALNGPRNAHELSYYFYDSLFYFYYNEEPESFGAYANNLTDSLTTSKEKIVLAVKDFSSFLRFNYTAVLFAKAYSFQYFDGLKMSASHKLDTAGGQESFTTTRFGENFLLFTFNAHQGKANFYDINRDVLISDLGSIAERDSKTLVLVTRYKLALALCSIAIIFLIYLVLNKQPTRDNQ